MYACDFCKSEHVSVSAMLACEEECAETDAATREYFGRYNPHRKD